MQGERQPPAAASAAIWNVLYDDNLLIEILLRVGFPTTLVNAALVCKRWLHHASDSKFLCRFREVHPPRLLGFYIDKIIGLPAPHFIPMLPQPPELTAVIQNARFCPSAWLSGLTYTYIKNCRNGSVFTERGRTGYSLGVSKPLCAERGMATVPPFPRCQPQDNRFCIWTYLLSKEQGDDLSYFYVSIESTKEGTKWIVRIYMLQDGVWCIHPTWVTDRPSPLLWEPKLVLVDSKIYMAAEPRNIIVLDLTVSGFSTICLPQGVEFGYRDSILSPADDASGVYLIKAKELKLHIWLHKCNNWLLVDTICLREMCANLRMSDCAVEDKHISALWIKQAGTTLSLYFSRWVDAYSIWISSAGHYVKCMT